MQTIAIKPILILTLILLGGAACGGPVTATPNKAVVATNGSIEVITDKDEIEKGECVVVGRVLTRGGGGTTAEDLEDQTRALGGNVVFVSAYAYKRRYVNYNVKGVAYYCYKIGQQTREKK